jgi:hypothetical protein
MVLRAVTLMAGLTGAIGLSQFPEFSQQYLQRLGGATDELARVIHDFDQDAATVGLTRATAMAELQQSGAFGAARGRTMMELIWRHDRLSADLAALEGAGPFTRARLAGHLGDREIAARAWRAYRPALPLTFEGAIFAGVGFLLSAGLVVMLRALFWALLGRRRGAAT